MAASQAKKAEAFRALHEGGTFVIPNPWDAGSARVLEALGFEALATSSAAFAFTRGRLDGDVTLDDVAGHIAELCDASDLPLSADLEDGYGDAPEDAARAITRAAQAGAVGGSIEDYSPRKESLYDLGHAVERVTAAVEAARVLDFPFTLTARAEEFFRNRDAPDLDAAIERLQAYERAGADVVYAPRLLSLDQIRAVCDAVEKPVNVLAFAQLGLSANEIGAAGVRRISVGSLLSLVAIDAFADAARQIRETGDFSALAAHPPVNEWLA
jgi:2-methylisocitrate lyase-like PEP mutase family enzyme